MTDFYWGNLSGNWADSKWSTSSGAGPYTAGPPTLSDNAIFNASSTATCTVSAAAACNSLVMTGGVLAGTAGLTIWGANASSVALKWGTADLYTGTVKFVGSSAGTYKVTTALKNGPSYEFAGGLTSNYQFQDKLAGTGSAGLTITSGSVDFGSIANHTMATFSIVVGGAASAGTVVQNPGSTWLIQGDFNVTSSSGQSSLTWPASIIINSSGSTPINLNGWNGTGTSGAIPSTTTVSYSGGGTGALAVNGYFGSVDFIGFSGTTITGSMFLAGDMRLASSLTSASNLSVTVNGTGTQKLTMVSTATATNFTINSSSSVLQLQDTLQTTGSINVTSGTISGNAHNATVGSFSVSDTSLAQALLSTGTWTMTGSGTPWSAGPNSVLTAGSSTVVLNNASSSNKTFAGGGKTYNAVSFTGAGTGAFIIQGSNTFGTFQVTTPPHTITFTSGTTQTITTLSVNGTAGNLNTINASSSGTAANIKGPTAGFFCDYLSIQDNYLMNCNGFAGLHSTLVSNDINWSLGFSLASSVAVKPSIRSVQKLPAAVTGKSAMLLSINSVKAVLAKTKSSIQITSKSGSSSFSGQATRSATAYFSRMALQPRFVTAALDVLQIKSGAAPAFSIFAGITGKTRTSTLMSALSRMPFSSFSQSVLRTSTSVLSSVNPGAKGSLRAASAAGTFPAAVSFVRSLLAIKESVAVQPVAGSSSLLSKIAVFSRIQNVNAAKSAIVEKLVAQSSSISTNTMNFAAKTLSAVRLISSASSFLPVALSAKMAGWTRIQGANISSPGVPGKFVQAKGSLRSSNVQTFAMRTSMLVMSRTKIGWAVFYAKGQIALQSRVAQKLFRRSKRSATVPASNRNQIPPSGT